MFFFHYSLTWAEVKQSPSPVRGGQGRGKTIIFIVKYIYGQKYILARELRKNLTKHERILWNILRNKQFHNLKFKRQEPIGKYIVDFICYSKNLIIEIDGGQHNEEMNIILDNERTKFLEDLGYRVIRFWNNDLVNNIEGVVLEIEKYI